MTTAAPHPNLDVVNAVYEAMAAGDRSALERLHHPDVVLHVSGSGPHAGDYVGRDEVLAVAATAGARQGGGEDAAATAVGDVPRRRGSHPASGQAPSAATARGA